MLWYKVHNQLFNWTGSSLVPILECWAKGHIFVSLFTTISPYLGVFAFSEYKDNSAPPWRHQMRDMCKASTAQLGSQELPFHNTHMAHNPPPKSSVEPPWCWSPALSLLSVRHCQASPRCPACQQQAQRKRIVCVSSSHIATVKKKWTSANVSLWFTAKCTHTHSHTAIHPQLTMVVNLD